MPDRDDVRWLKEKFGDRIQSAVAGTPLSADLVAAIACQETGYIWRVLRHKPLTEARLLMLCVGDTLDADRGRGAFPKTKSDLVARPGGQAMFDVARQALVDMAQHIPGYRAAASRPNKFCHGFGMFQRDLQFFLGDPQYFLQRRWGEFDQTLHHCLDELRRDLRKLRWQDRSALDDMEQVAVAIVYNCGKYVPARGLRQGHRNGDRYYGQDLFDFLRLCQSVPWPSVPVAPPAPEPGNAFVPPPGELVATGRLYRVDTRVSTLRLRREPRISRPTTANVIAELPDGHLVRALQARAENDFREIETSLGGARFQGFAASRFLVPAAASEEIEVLVPAPAPPRAGVVAVTMPRKSGTVTRRRDNAGAHSLNETGRPSRTGTDAATLRAELAAIVDWLGVDKPAHKRYWPRAGLTFCNIYAHDYCMLAGVYLPRVWWKATAIARLENGEAVEPLYEDTIEEVRANGLFRWLREFGPTFGWRQSESATALQLDANQGAVCLIVARRKEDGRSGHMTAVVAEADGMHARRDATGAVVAPLQSQAGAGNFRYGTSTQGWWLDAKFAESAFWVHA
jgi:hypothetical protein